MEIILKEDVINLGYKNDIVTVKSGYGRNYLIPTGKAVIASPAAKKMLAEELKQRAHKLEKIKKDAEELAAKLEGVSLKIATKVSSTGTIFGSVINENLSDEVIVTVIATGFDRKEQGEVKQPIFSNTQQTRRSSREDNPYVVAMSENNDDDDDGEVLDDTDYDFPPFLRDKNF